jgi:hypothetical protein
MRIKQKRIMQLGIVVAMLAYVFTLVPVSALWALTANGGGGGGTAAPTPTITLGGDVTGPSNANSISAIRGQSMASPTGSPGNALTVNASGTVVWTATPAVAATSTPGSDIALRATPLATATANVNAISYTVPASAQVGDLAIMVVSPFNPGGAAGPSATPPSGWIQQVSLKPTGNFQFTQIFTKVVAAPDIGTAYTVTVPTSTFGMAICAMDLYRADGTAMTVGASTSVALATTAAFVSIPQLTLSSVPQQYAFVVGAQTGGGTAMTRPAVGIPVCGQNTTTGTIGNTIGAVISRYPGEMMFEQFGGGITTNFTGAAVVIY